MFCRPAGPKAFKHYLLDLPDEVTPQEAQQRYDDYLADYWGSEVRIRPRGIIAVLSNGFACAAKQVWWPLIWVREVPMQ